MNTIIRNTAKAIDDSIINASRARLADFASIIAFNEYEVVAPGVEAFTAMNAMHAEALALNTLVDQAVAVGTTGNINCWPTMMNHAVSDIRDALFSYYGKVQARFVVKMMISVRRLAREATDRRIAEYQEMLSRPVAEPSDDSEIPF